MLGSFSDMLSTVFCTTRHWQTSGRLVQELNVSTVHVLPTGRSRFAARKDKKVTINKIVGLASCDKQHIITNVKRLTSMLVGRLLSVCAHLVDRYIGQRMFLCTMFALERLCINSSTERLCRNGCRIFRSTVCSLFVHERLTDISVNECSGHIRQCLHDQARF